MVNARFSRRQVVLGAAAVPLAWSVLPRAVSAAPSPMREQVELDTGWSFRFGERGDWQRIRLPHSWNARDGQDGGDDYRRGAGWYRRELPLSAESAGRRAFLEFDGANTTTDVWLNGVHLGQHSGGYTRFRFDVTEVLRPGANDLLVRVDNGENPDVAPLSADFTFFGGLYRGVRLQLTEPVHLDLLDHGGPGVYLRQREVRADAATVEVTAKLANDSEQAQHVDVRATITDDDGRVVAEESAPAVSLAAGGRRQCTFPVHIGSPRLWNGRADPHVHRVQVQLREAETGRPLDAVTEPLGLRTFAVSPSDGFSLNGEPLRLRGVNRHQDRRGKGFAVDDGDHEQDFALMREMGVNALRTAHYPQDPLVYDLADSAGFAVYTEVPWVNEITDSAAFRDNVKQQLRELIRQHYNHPSVLFWGIGNELGFHQTDKDPQINALLAELAELVRTEDPERASAYANVLKRADDDPFTEHAELSGYNRYEGWYEGTADQFGQWADSLHAADPMRKIAVTEYGAGANIDQHGPASLAAPPVPDGQWHPEEYQALLHESFIAQIDERPYLWGTFLWNMFDFASDSRDEGAAPGINDKGLVTHDRAVRKDAFHCYKAHWSDEAVLHITSRRWTHRTEPDTTVRVYSNAESVALTLNGAPLGDGTRDGRVFSWPVRLRPGSNVLTAQAEVHGSVHTDEVTWQLSQQ